MTDPDLIRFLDAQDQIFGQVVDELTNGHKQTHWMWFVFPQLAGLGRSAMAQHYAIKDLAQAKRYLADSILGARLRQVIRIMASHHEKSAYEILGSPDDLKFRSCLTCFAKPHPTIPIAPYLPRPWSNFIILNLTRPRSHSCDDSTQPTINRRPDSR
jgi:uncharacterized protein (DUF1810 family)